jgi:hypothetical protein
LSAVCDILHGISSQAAKQEGLSQIILLLLKIGALLLTEVHFQTWDLVKIAIVGLGAL